jgi:hypothetical protein
MELMSFFVCMINVGYILVRLSMQCYCSVTEIVTVSAAINWSVARKSYRNSQNNSEVSDYCSILLPLTSVTVTSEVQLRG